MATKRELILDLLARDKTDAATRSAAKNLGNVGDAAEDAAKSAEKLGDNSDRAEDQVGRLGKSSRTAAEHVEHLDREINSVERELQQLAVAFAEAEAVADRLDLSKAIRRTEGDLRRLNKSKGLIASILPDDPGPAAKSFMGKLGGALASAGSSVGALAGNHVGLTVGAAAGAAAAPVLLGTLSAALSAGVGAGVIGVGIMAAAKSDTTIQLAGAEVAKKFGQGLAREADAAFQGPILGALETLDGAGEHIVARLGVSFRKLAPELEPFTRKIAAAGVALTDDLAGAAEQSGPAVQALGDSVEFLADGVGNFVTSLSRGGPEAASNLRLVVGGLSDMVTWSGNSLALLNDLSNNPIVSGALLPKLREHYDDAATASGTFAARTRDSASAMTDAAHAAFVEGNELTNLAADMRAQTDPVFGLLTAEDKLAEAQKNAGKAARDHGRDSKEAKQALRDLAEAAIEVEGRAGELAETSGGKLSPALRATLRAAKLTDDQINDLAGQFRGAKRDGDNFAKKYQAKVEADTAAAEARLKHVRELLDKVHSKKISVNVLVNESRLNKVNNTLDRFGGARAGGGPVEKNKAYVVGEHRPEVFVPKQDGMIVPSISRFTGGGGGQAAGSREVRIVVDVTGAETRMKAMIREMFKFGGLEAS